VYPRPPRDRGHRPRPSRIRRQPRAHPASDPCLEPEDIDAALAYAAWRLEEGEEDMLPEYSFDFSKARPNHFAAQ
jgi:hypothetical protein